MQTTQDWLEQASSNLYLYLTTTGRRTGQPHRIEIWFGVQDGRVYLLAGGRDRSDWMRNIRANSKVTIELGDKTHTGVARVLDPGTAEDQLARELLVAKYREGDNLDDWGRNSLPVAIEFPGEGTAMTQWTPDELDRIGSTDELQIAAERPDGTLRTSRIIWVVRVGDDLFVRSAHGHRAAWHRGVERTRQGHISAGGIEKDVLFEDAAGQLDAEIDAAYWAKYGHYLRQYVEPVTDDESHTTTIRLVPRSRP